MDRDGRTCFDLMGSVYYSTNTDCSIEPPGAVFSKLMVPTGPITSGVVEFTVPERDVVAGYLFTRPDDPGTDGNQPEIQNFAVTVALGSYDTPPDNIWVSAKFARVTASGFVIYESEETGLSELRTGPTHRVFVNDVEFRTWSAHERLRVEILVWNDTGSDALIKLGFGVYEIEGSPILCSGLPCCTAEVPWYVTERYARRLAQID